MMFYVIKNKYYVKAAGRYTEVIPKMNPVGKIIFVPTTNSMSIREVGRDYSTINVDEARGKILDKLKKNSNKTKEK